MKLLAFLLAVAASVAAVTGLVLLSNGPAGPSPATAAAQHLTMKVLTDSDRMVGPNLVARPGQIVLTIVNYARHAHTFSIPRLGVDRVVLPGSPTHPSISVIRFSTPYGTFHWYCKLPCRQAMAGDLYISWNPPQLHGPLFASV